MSFDDVVFLFILLVLAAGLGILSQRLLRLKLGGLIVSTFLGFVGALLGKYAAVWLNLPSFGIGLSLNGHHFPLVWAVVGALVATLTVASIAKGASKEKKKN